MEPIFEKKQKCSNNSWVIEHHITCGLDLRTFDFFEPPLSTVSNLNLSWIELELELGFDNKVLTKKS